MKTLKTLHYAIIFATIFILGAFGATAQKNHFAYEGSQDQVLFWFNVKLSKTTSKISKLEIYNVRVISPTIYNGTAKAYQKILWQGSSQGTKITVGPFIDYQEAKAALELYKHVRDTAFVPNDNSKYGYWFLVKVNITERSHAYQFERMAARVAGGNKQEFLYVLRESLGFKTLAIGPFDDELEAERAKSLYRIEE